MYFDDNDYSDISALTVGFAALGALALCTGLSTLDAATGWFGMDVKAYAVTGMTIGIMVIIVALFAFKSGLLSEFLVLASTSVSAVSFTAMLIAGIPIGTILVLNLPFAIMTGLAAFMAVRDHDIPMIAVAVLATAMALSFMLGIDALSGCVAVAYSVAAFAYCVINWNIIRDIDEGTYDDIFDGGDQ